VQRICDKIHARKGGKIVHRKLGFVVVTFVLIALVTTACQSASGSKTVNVTLMTTEFKFSPDTINAKVGDRVQVTLDNTKGTLKHNIKQADLNIDAAVEAGQKTTFEFTATKAGTFDFVCDVPGHKDAGMTGKIIVQP
jgi:plastocyanin